MKIEIKEIEITIGEEFNTDSYDDCGMYLNEGGLMFVHPKYVYFIMSKEEFIKHKDKFLSKDVECKKVEKETKIENSVSESFALKMLEIVVGHTLEVDINE